VRHKLEVCAKVICEDFLSLWCFIEQNSGAFSFALQSPIKRPEQVGELDFNFAQLLKLLERVQNPRERKRDVSLSLSSMGKRETLCCSFIN